MAEFAVFLRFLLGTTFVLAGLSKIRQREAFGQAVRDYAVLPDALAVATARVLPATEVLLGGLLLIGARVEAAASVVGVLLLAFACAVTLNLARGRHINCGCAGVFGHAEISWLTVSRIVLLVACAAVVVWKPVPVLGVDALGSRTPAGLSAADSLALLIASTLLVIASAVTRETIRALRLSSGMAEASK